MKLSQIASFLVAGSMIYSAAVSAAQMDATQKKQVEGVVREYLVQNPEVIVESLQSWQQKQMSKSIEKTQSTAVQLADTLFHSSTDPIGGNPKGKVTVVEFFDYQCAHCIDMQPVVTELLKKNPDVRFVYKEFPIRGVISEMAAKAALAAAQQGKYTQLHDALMSAAAKGSLTEADIYTLAKSVGLDIDKLKTAMQSDAVSKQIKANYQLAQQLQLMGTPAIFVAKTSVSKGSPATAIEFFPGQVSAEQLNQLISKVSG